MDQTATAAPPQGAKDTTKGFALPSGATLHIQRPAFADASRLRNAIARALSASPLKPEEMKLTLETLKDAPSEGGALISRLLTLVSSETVEDAIFACLAQSTYQPKGTPARIKITRELFDDERFGDDARVDMYPMFGRVAEVAIKPFLGALVSMYMEFRKKGAADLPSPSTSTPKGS